MARPKLPPGERKKYVFKSFYYPVSPHYDLVWSFFESMLTEATNPNSPHYNPKLIRGTIVRRLIFKYIAGEIDKRRQNNTSNDVCENVYEAIRKIIEHENAKIEQVMTRKRNEQR